jgi:thymidylate kinase
MTAVRFLLYFLDAISLRAVVQQSLKADVDVIIFDRYLYDELANLGLRSIITRAYARLLLRLVPQPEISFWLDVDPAHARARKPEYPLDFLCSNRMAYLALSQLAGGWTIIAPQSIHKPIHQSIHDVGSHVLQQVLKKLSLDKTIRPADCAADGQLDAPATL